MAVAREGWDARGHLRKQPVPALLQMGGEPVGMAGLSPQAGAGWGHGEAGDAEQQGGGFGAGRGTRGSP